MNEIERVASNGNRLCFRNQVKRASTSLDWYDKWQLELLVYIWTLLLRSSKVIMMTVWFLTSLLHRIQLDKV